MPPDRLSRLSDAELVDLLAGKPRLRETEYRYERLADVVNRTVSQLRHELGLGPAGARRLAAACELYRRLAAGAAPNRVRMIGPEEVAQHMVWVGTFDHERLWALPLDSRSRTIGEAIEISRGDVDGCEAGPRAFYRAVLRTGATSAIAVHNHPTGEIVPSHADIAVTRRLVSAGHQLDVPLVDHVIVGSAGRFTSLRRERPDLFTQD